MLTDYTEHAGSEALFRKMLKPSTKYIVNMTCNARTLHKVNSPHCNYSKYGFYDFIQFDSLEDVRKFEKDHDVSFIKCGNCFETE